MQNAVRISAGRLSLDVPSVKEFYFQKAEISDIALTWIPLPSGQTFATWLAARTADINNGKLSPGIESPMIRNYKLQPDLPINLYSPYVKQPTQRLEAYRDFHDHVLMASTEGQQSDVPLSEKLMRDVLNGFQQTNLGAPVPAGFAVDGGLVHREFSYNETADATATFHVDGVQDDRDTYPRLEIRTDVYSNAGPSTLLNRVRRGDAFILLMQAEDPGFHTRSLRRGKRTVAGLPGEESFELIYDPKDHPDTYAVTAEFEFGGDASNPVRPYTQITLNLPSVPKSFDTRQFLTLWDQILGSVRFHP